MSVGSSQVGQLQFEIERLKTKRGKGNSRNRGNTRRQIERLEKKVESLLSRASETIFSKKLEYTLRDAFNIWKFNGSKHTQTMKATPLTISLNTAFEIVVRGSMASNRASM